jgi:hypothetical protein
MNHKETYSLLWEVSKRGLAPCYFLPVAVLATEVYDRSGWGSGRGATGQV